MTQDHDEVWARVLGDLARKVRPELVRDWLADLELTSCRPEAVTLTAPSPLHAKLVRDHYAELLVEGFQRALGRRPRISFDAPQAPTRVPGSPLPRPAWNPTFTLEAFVEGSSNRLALAACRAVVDRPGELYNPLFIHGASGTGKTHLLQAVCRALAPRRRVLHLSADEFSGRVAASSAEIEILRDELRSLQVLALDDTQTLAGREASQEELLHTFNSLYNSNCQLLLAADQPPRDLTGLPERLTSRFTWGLVVEIEPPLFETRLEILASRASARGLSVPAEVLEELASAKTTSVRELEGLLSHLSARATLGDQPLTRELARGLLTSRATQKPARSVPSSEQIQRLVASTFGLRPSDLLGPSRTRSVALARHVAIYLARQLTDLPLQEIGGHFGGRDHSTINYAINKVSTLIQQDQPLARTVRRLSEQLRGSKHVNK